jgi:hypothetical protein
MKLWKFIKHALETVGYHFSVFFFRFVFQEGLPFMNHDRAMEIVSSCNKVAFTKLAILGSWNFFSGCWKTRNPQENHAKMEWDQSQASLKLEDDTVNGGIFPTHPPLV